MRRLTMANDFPHSDGDQDFTASGEPRDAAPRPRLGNICSTMNEPKLTGHHIVFLNRVFPPSYAATAQVFEELAIALVRLGWQVSVVTTRSSRQVPRRAVEHGVRIYRCAGLSYRQTPFFYRALSYLTLYPALLWGVRRAGPADLLIIGTDPPLILVPATVYARWHGIPVVHWAHDVYPAIAVAAGLIRPTSLLGRYLEHAMGRALDRCKAILAVGRCMADVLSKHTHAQIRLLPNWANTDNIRPVPHEENPFRASLNAQPNAQIVMYSGNFGVSHPFDAILAAMAELQQTRPNAHFVMIGGGARLKCVKEAALRLALNNVTFLPHQPYSQLSLTLSAADIHLACMEPSLLGLVVPSKVYGIMAAGRPCIFLGPHESEVARLIEEEELGEVLAPGQNAQLAQRLERWLDDPHRLKCVGDKARIAAGHASLDHAAAAFSALARGLLDRA